MADRVSTPREVGQTWKRQRGPALYVTLRKLNDPRPGWAMCSMRDDHRSYGEKPIALDLLDGVVFARV